MTNRLSSLSNILTLLFGELIDVITIMVGLFLLSAVTATPLETGSFAVLFGYALTVELLRIAVTLVAAWILIGTGTRRYEFLMVITILLFVPLIVSAFTYFPKFDYWPLLLTLIFSYLISAKIRTELGLDDDL